TCSRESSLWSVMFDMSFALLTDASEYQHFAKPMVQRPARTLLHSASWSSINFFRSASGVAAIAAFAVCRDARFSNLRNCRLSTGLTTLDPPLGGAPQCPWRCLAFCATSLSAAQDA